MPPGLPGSAVAATVLAPAGVVAMAPKLSDGHGLHIAAQRQLSLRLLTASVTTGALDGRSGNPALHGPANVRILLPRATR